MSVDNRGQKRGTWITKHKRLAIYLRDGFKCAYCGEDLHGAAPAMVTLDHLVCRTNGGSNAPTNLVTACRTCNSRRQDKPWTQYATGGAFERIRSLRYRKLNVELARAILNGEHEWRD